jgi:hypothetical protein
MASRCLSWVRGLSGRRSTTGFKGDMGISHAVSPKFPDYKAPHRMPRAPPGRCAAQWGRRCWPLGPPTGPLHGPLPPQTHGASASAIVSTFAPRGYGWPREVLGRGSVEPGIGSCHHSHELAEPVPMDAPALRESKRLIVLRLRTQKGVDFVKDAAKPCCGMPSFEPARGPRSWLDANSV